MVRLREIHKIEIAKTNAKSRQGLLSFRRCLQQNRG